MSSTGHRAKLFSPAFALRAFWSCAFSDSGFRTNHRRRKYRRSRHRRVSSSSRRFNWKKRARHPELQFAYHQSDRRRGLQRSEGSPDELERSARRCRWIVRGAYHFFTFGTSGQVSKPQILFRQVPVELSALPPAIDLEFSGYEHSHAQCRVRQTFNANYSAFWDAHFLAAIGKTAGRLHDQAIFRNNISPRMPIEPVLDSQKSWIKRRASRGSFGNSVRSGKQCRAFRHSSI